MAKTKEEKMATQQAEVVTENKNMGETAGKTGPTYDELLGIIQMLSDKVTALESQSATPASKSGTNDLADILSTLTNRKSDKEVSIVHNCQLNGGLTTHIDLSNTTIDFRTMGETRLLSWQQFEECVSKYRSFFDRRVILLDKGYEDIAEQYGIPCKSDNKDKHILTKADMTKLPKMSVTDLEKFIEKLDDKDKDTVFSYWLGKCYTREEGFYDRYKVDTLNRLSKGAFQTLILVMNGDDREDFANDNK